MASQAGHKERFFRYFQHEVTALQEQMERLATTASAGGERADAVDHCLAGIDRLSHEVKDASAYIPAYDQRTYADAIKALSEKLQGIRNTFAPPKKFQFKTARKNNSAISIADAAEMARGRAGAPTSLGLTRPGSGADSGMSSGFAPTPLSRMSPGEEKRELKTPGHAEPSNAGVTVSNHTSSHIILPGSSSHTAGSATISNLRRSIVDLSPSTTHGGPFASLMLKNVKGSLIVCGHIAGPIHVTDVENSVLVIACRQFRMHGSRGVDVYLHCTSRPIIEDCQSIRFAPLPTTYVRLPPTGRSRLHGRAHPLQVTPDLSQAANQYDQIDDFKWLKTEPSPNFSLISESDRVDEEVWKTIVPGGHSTSLDDILQAVTIREHASPPSMTA